MTMRARFLGAIAMITLVAIARDAAAEGRRVLFVAPETTPFAARVRAEIEAMGFDIDPAPILVEDGTTTAVAAARVIESPPRRVELWITDPATGKLTIRAFVMPSADEDEAIQTVRASEQLRAFFQPLQEPKALSLAAAPAPVPEPPSPAASPSTNPPAAVPTVMAPPPKPAAAGPRFVVGAALAVPFQPGGPGLDLTLSGRWMATDHLGVGALLSVPLAGSTVTSTEGSASMSATLFGASLSWVVDVIPELRLSAQAGPALAWLRTNGFAATPYQGKPSNIAVLLGFIGAEIAPRLTERVHLCFDGQVGVSLPRADIAFAGRTVAAWGRPLGMLSAGASVDW
ncbi:hypothetical protein A7982_13105 [Minicystis rosea]|nr:hypothetical protein A7982_13105 [Minicystis rosea]